MHNTVDRQLPIAGRQERRLRAGFTGLLWLLLSAAVIGLSACQPGSDSEDGIDPGIVQVPIAFIKRPIPVDDMGESVQAELLDPLLFGSGGDIYLRSSTLFNAEVKNITSAVTGGIGDVKGLNASYDGTRLIFSLRLFDEIENDDREPSWNIYEYDMEAETIRRVITSELVAEEGQDLFPVYLPDGRILFTSDRQRQSGEMLINEGKPLFSALDEDEDAVAMVLHVMNADGSELRQVSFNQSHDLYPQVLSERNGGKIVFSRWDNSFDNNGVHLYTMNPDGSELEVLYGVNSHDSGAGNPAVHFTQPREMENGDIMAILKPFTGTFDGGDIVIIDVDRFADIDTPVWSLSGLTGPGQLPATINQVAIDGSISLGGRYSSAFPLRDGTNRILASKSTCQIRLAGEILPCAEPELSDPAAEEASPAYAIWLYDVDVDTEKPVVVAEPGMVITEVITVQVEPLPPVIFDKGPGELDGDWETEGVGVVNIRSVYDFADTTFDGCFFGMCAAALGATGITSVEDFTDPGNATAAQRPARFVRFIKPVGIPDPDDPGLANSPSLRDEAFGPQRSRGMREIVGYAPVEPDGSVKVKVPGNIPLGIEVLDGEGRRIGPIHHNWFQVQPGDMLTCNGCHIDNAANQPRRIHARSDAIAPSINSGLPAQLQFENTLIQGLASPNPYWGNLGQTMAEVRFDRVSITDPVSIQPQLSADLVYDDYWTDPAVRPADTSYAYRYANLLPPAATPENRFCVPWLFNCRVIINYPQHIHPIWQVDRGLLDNNMNGIGDDTCIECHTPAPAGGLDLSDGDSDQNANHLKSYRELLFADPTASVGPSISVEGARQSYFIEKMTETELDAERSLTPFNTNPNLYFNHSGLLSGDELKLISEWIDLGAQNFNDPFDPMAPQN